MATPSRGRPARTLLVLLLATLALGVWTFWPGTSNLPQLGLDLRGGTQVILVPKTVEEGGTVTDDQLKQAVEIIRQRVNGVGVAEADVTQQGSGANAAIVVSVPGVSQERIVDLVGRTALLDFRAVENALAPAPISATPSATASPVNPSASPSPAASLGSPTAEPAPTASASPTGSASPAGSASPTGNGRPLAGLPQAAVPAATSPTPTGSASPTAAASPNPSPSPSDSASPGTATLIQSPANDAPFQTKVADLNCTLPINRAGGTPDDPKLWLGTCDRDGQVKYILQPAFILGTNVTSAEAVLAQGGVGGWSVSLSFDAEGSRKLSDVSGQLVGKEPPQNQFAIVLDGVVYSAPRFISQITGGNAEITGDFTAQEAQDLANVLKYGALPVTLDVAQVESVSATLGDDQLNAGLLAGAIGLVLVIVYLLAYYRALGVVAVASLLVAAAITYGAFVVLGRTLGFTLTLAGVAGAIVAIGITADSFVVYFERIRDEIREGKSLRQATDSGWDRAKRTILAADFVSFLAAVVLYWLSVGGVRGFAFTLGLTTLIDVLVAFTFSRPLVVLMGRTPWMQSGSAWTGLSPDRLGVTSLTGTAPVRGTRGAGNRPGVATRTANGDRHTGDSGKGNS